MARRWTVQSGFLLGMALLILIMSWEANAAGAALAAPTIPEQAIRIRIVANSDSVQDQWIKREIQQAIAATLVDADGLRGSLEEARDAIGAKLPEWDALVAELLARYGFTYGHDMMLGDVQFPAKIYNKHVYPAGSYEAVRITLGSGNGQNWWCVLFPPLCLGSGTVKAAAAEQEAQKPEEQKQAQKPEVREQDQRPQQGLQEREDASGHEASVSAEGWRSVAQADGEAPEVRFFLADALKSLKGFFQDLLG